MSNINKKSEVLKKVTDGEKVMIIDTTISNSGGFINPFEIEVEKNNREEIISNFKELLSHHYKFTNESKGQKLCYKAIYARI